MQDVSPFETSSYGPRQSTVSFKHYCKLHFALYPSLINGDWGSGLNSSCIGLQRLACRLAAVLFGLMEPLVLCFSADIMPLPSQSQAGKLGRHEDLLHTQSSLLVWLSAMTSSSLTEGLLCRVDSGLSLADVLNRHSEWLTAHSFLRRAVPVTWSDWDLKVKLCKTISLC